MHDKVFIVARTRREANDYAADAGLKRGDFTVISEVGQLRAARRGEIHLVDGWEQHPKRHALRAALRYTRIEVFEVDAPGAEAPQIATTTTNELDPGLAAAISGLDPRGDLTERQFEAAYRYNAMLTKADVAQRQVAALERGMPTGIVSTIGQPFEVSSEDEQATETEPSEDPAPTEEQVARRRSRCKECGELHYKGDPCPAPED